MQTDFVMFLVECTPRRRARYQRFESKENEIEAESHKSDWAAERRELATNIVRRFDERE